MLPRSVKRFIKLLLYLEPLISFNCFSSKKFEGNDVLVLSDHMENISPTFIDDIEVKLEVLPGEHFGKQLRIVVLKSKLDRG